jgi:hypothetical protein
MIKSQEKLDGLNTWHVWGSGEVHTEFWWENVRGKRPLGRRGRRWGDYIKIDLQEVRWGMDWTDLAEVMYRWRVLVNSVVNIRVP